MRTIVDIPEPSLQWLADYCKREDISRAEAVRRALREFRKQIEPSEAEKRAEDARIIRATAGLWKDDPFWKNKDSVQYIREIRDEWEDPWETK